MAITGEAVLEEVITQLTYQLGLWTKGLGIIALLMILYYIANFFMNRRQAQDLSAIRKNLENINSKLDKILKKR